MQWIMWRRFEEKTKPSPTHRVSYALVSHSPADRSTKRNKALTLFTASLSIILILVFLNPWKSALLHLKK